MVATDAETGRGQDEQTFLCNILEKRSEPPNVGGVSGGSRNGAPFERVAWSKVR